MKLVIVTATTTLLFCAAAGAQTPGSGSPPTAVTLEDAYRAALARNETIGIETSRSEQTEARVSEARSALLPNVTGTASTIRQSDRPATNGRGSRANTQTTARATLTQPIYAAGAKSALDEVKTLNEAQKQNLDAARASLFLSVAQAYYEVQAAEADLKNLQTSVDLTQTRVKDLQARARIGRSRPGEVLTAQSQLGVLNSSVQVAIDRVSRARQEFQFQTGMNQNSVLAAAASAPQAPQPLESYFGKLPDRPDIKALELRAQSAGYGTEYARAGHMPTLNFIGNGYWTKDASDHELDWDVGLALSIPIFEGGAVNARVREAKAVETEALLNLHRQKRTAQTEIERAHQSLSSSLLQSQALDEALTAAEKNYKQETRDYSLGLVTNLDVLQALTTMQETRRSVDRTRFEALLHWAELKSAVQELPAEKR